MKSWQERRDEACLTAMSTLGKNADVPGVFYFDGWNQGRADALREVRPKLERVRELLEPAYTNQAYIMIEELLKDLAEQEKEKSECAKKQ